ncbi:hypothetical protein [Paracoccus sp. KR1-242]|uniref:hypothetical protein n=1 Tax=Paracoccus sp. KR1-242 TaxID=3410028 RepID=UPI003C038161
MQATFPHLAIAKAPQFRLLGQSLDPEESIDGTDTVVPTMRGRWTATVSFVLRQEAALLQWRAFLMQMRGRVGTTPVPVYSRFRPRDRDGRGGRFNQIGNFDSSQTMEHWGFSNAPREQVMLNLNAGLRATEIEVRYPDSTGLRPGHYFSLRDRLYCARAVYLSRQTENGPRFSVEFDPPLREAVTAGMVVEINRPVCRMRLATEDEGIMDNAEIMQTVQARFVEAL